MTNIYIDKNCVASNILEKFNSAGGRFFHLGDFFRVSYSEATTHDGKPTPIETICPILPTAKVRDRMVNTSHPIDGAFNAKAWMSASVH